MKTRDVRRIATLLASLLMLACGGDGSGGSGGTGGGGGQAMNPANLPDGVLWSVSLSGAASSSHEGNIVAYGEGGGSRVLGFGAGDDFSLIVTVPLVEGETGTYEVSGTAAVDGTRYSTDPSGGAEATLTVTIIGWGEVGLPPEQRPIGTITGQLGYSEGAAVDPPLEVSAAFDYTASPF